MNKLALQLPGFSSASPIAGPSGFSPEFTDLGSLITPFLGIALSIAAFVSFYFLVWGAFQYILSSGNKEDLGKARARITWALVGLLFIISAFLIAKYGYEIFPPRLGGTPF